MLRALLPPLIMACSAIPASAQIVPVDDVQEMVMVNGADHVLQLASQCTSMFLRGSPIPTAGFDVTSAEISQGQATLQMERDAPFDWGRSEMSVSLYDEDGQANLDCSGTAMLGEGSLDVVWNALHRHTLGIGALMWGAELPAPPNVLRMETCLQDFPTPDAVTAWEVQFARSDVGDTITFYVFGSRAAWGDGCLELE